LYFFWKPGETVIDRNRLNAGEWALWGSRGVWQIASVRSNREHEAQFPLELAEKVVRLLTEEGDVVLDPFMGSGTTAIAALQNNRTYIGLEREEKYVALAKQRIFEAQKQISLF
ncbi:site-specific DNA-methyltransferase, partial [Vibrio anguillarum]